MTADIAAGVAQGSAYNYNTAAAQLSRPTRATRVGRPRLRRATPSAAQARTYSTPGQKDAAGNVSAAYGALASVTVGTAAPTAGSLAATNITDAGGTSYSFTVSFSDNLAIDSASLGTGDIRVTGPAGFSQLATLVSSTPASNGTPRTATYQISAPGGAWDAADRGSWRGRCSIRKASARQIGHRAREDAIGGGEREPGHA